MTDSAKIQDEIDKLIDWYKANRPEAGQEILVNVASKHLIKFARPIIPDVLYSYRGRRLRCARERVD